MGLLNRGCNTDGAGNIGVTGYRAGWISSPARGAIQPGAGLLQGAGAGLRRTIAELKRTTGYTPEIVNIGGGYAQERDPESRSLSLNPYEIEEYAESITGPLLEGLEQAGIPIPALWMEPGRYVVGNAVVLLGRVGTVKRDLEKVWVNVDVSVNNLMRIETAHSTYHVLAANHLLDPHDEVVDIVGPLCLGAPLGSGRTFPHVVRDVCGDGGESDERGSEASDGAGQ